MRQELENHTKVTEQKIRDALQEFHDNTGLIPTSVTLSMVDVRTVGQMDAGKRAALVGECLLHAQL